MCKFVSSPNLSADTHHTTWQNHAFSWSREHGYAAGWHPGRQGRRQALSSCLHGYMLISLGGFARPRSSLPSYALCRPGSSTISCYCSRKNSEFQMQFRRANQIPALLRLSRCSFRLLDQSYRFWTRLHIWCQLPDHIAADGAWFPRNDHHLVAQGLGRSPASMALSSQSWRISRSFQSVDQQQGQGQGVAALSDKMLASTRHQCQGGEIT